MQVLVVAVWGALGLIELASPHAGRPNQNPPLSHLRALPCYLPSPSLPPSPQGAAHREDGGCIRSAGSTQRVGVKQLGARGQC
jgi:hypothetical protein